jgi:Uma2 family endonuclease
MGARREVIEPIGRGVVERGVGEEAWPAPWRYYPTGSKVRMTYEEFLEWCDEDTWAEWVDGEVIVLTPASNRHQDLSDFLAFVMRAFVEAHNLGIVRSAPFLMKTGPELPGREPDILFIAREHLARLKETYLDGPADLVVEIVSPESMGRDRGGKFYEYEEGGVGEYWLIDSQRRRAEFYRLGEKGWYQLIPVGEEGAYQSEVVSGFWLKPSWFWEEPLPQVLDVLRELGVV